MLAIFLACVGFLAGYALGRVEQKPKLELRLLITLDATQPVAISATGKDSEGNPIDISASELVLTATPTNDKNFGEVNDANDTFNPGEAGATGTITGTVTIGDAPYSASVDIELAAGGLSSIDLSFAPA